MEKNTLKAKLLMIYKKIFNREFITYGVVGVLTTCVNFASYYGLKLLQVPDLATNVIAWVVAVTFAYIMNKLIVFASKSDTVRDETIKITKFYGARLVSLGVEELGILIFVHQMGLSWLITKAALAIIVIILNYIFSKLYIFNK